MTQEKTEELLADLEFDELTITQAAKKYGISKSQIRNIAFENGMILNPSRKEMCLIAAERDSGKPLDEIVCNWNLTPETLAYFLKSYDSRQHRNKFSLAEREEIKEKYLNGEETKALAKFYRTTPGTIRIALNKQGIDTGARSRSQISKETKEAISKEEGALKEIAEKYHVSITTVWKIKDKKFI